MSLHLYKISVPRRLRRGCHWPMKSFSAVCPPLQFLPHQKTHNTWARAPAHWAWLTEVWPLSPSDPTGTLWALISVSCRDKCAPEKESSSQIRKETGLQRPQDSYLLSPHPGLKARGVGSSLWGRSEISNFKALGGWEGKEERTTADNLQSTTPPVSHSVCIGNLLLP